MKKILVSYILLLFCLTAISQDYISTISNFSSKDGLSSDKIYALHKDARGFIWIGTMEGLNRFDGSEFKVYSMNNRPDMTIKTIHEIFEDDEGYLWLLKKKETYSADYTLPEINLLNIYTGKITTPDKHFNNTLPFKIEDIGFMKMLGDGQLYFFSPTQNKVYSYSSSIGFQSFHIPKHILYVNDMLLQEDGNFLIKASGSKVDWMLYKINVSGKIIAQNPPNLHLDVNHKGNSSKIVFKGQNLVKGGFNLDAYNYFTPNLIPKETQTNTSAENIDQTYWNEDQQLFWLKSNNRISVIQPDGKVVFQKNEQFDDEEIPILFDGNTTWLSNKREGLMAIHLKSSHFKNQQFFDHDFDNSTRGIFNDISGNLWVSTIAGNVKIDTNQQVTITEHDRLFTRFRTDNGGNLWYYQNGEIVKYHLITKDKRVYSTKNFGIEAWDFAHMDNDEIWISSHNGLLLKLNPITGEISPKAQIPCDMNIALHIYEWIKRKGGNFWVCTNQGLYLLSDQGETIAIYNNEKPEDYFLPAKSFHHFYQDEEGLIWLATGDGGLLKLKMHKQESNELDPDQRHGYEKLEIINQYTIANGLSSNAIHSVYQDDYEYLWLSSDYGLMQFDKRTEKVYKYFVEDGIPHNEFNRIAHFQTKDGQLLFGGLLGVTALDPKNFSNVREQEKSGSLVIAEYEQFSGKKEKFEDLTTQLVETRSIVLQPDDQFFKLKVALLDYQSTHKTYRYRIIGLFDWQENNTGAFNISGLPYGEYSLEIRARNANQQEASNNLTIKILVLYPFYLRWWFLVLSIVAIGLLVRYLILRKTKQLLLRQEAEQLKTLDQMKSRFFINITHELKTPLTLIGLPLDHLLKNFEQFSEKEVKEYLKAAKTNQRDLDRMINGILDLAKLEAGKLEIQSKPVLLKDFIDRVVYAFQSSADSKKINLRFSSFIPEKINVSTDEGKLEMVINNLLSNALKFTPDGGSITINADWDENDTFYFKIQDSGRGIHADDLPHIFERYYQTNQKDLPLEGGSGIGLAICKDMLELMGGKIRVMSAWNEGSTFSINLPMTILEGAKVECKEIEKQVSIQTEENSETSLFNEKLTILIVEDNAQIRYHIQNILSPIYKVITAVNGKDALEKLSTTNFELIVSDVMMPEMDGFSLLEKVKKDDNYRGIPFILLTARTNLQDKLHGLRIGVDAYMTKPFDVEELLVRSHNLILNAQGRNITHENSEQVGHNKEAPVSKMDNNSIEITHEDLEWLKSIEEIALREVKNATYSIDDLAQELFMSRSKVFLEIKKITGLTPKKYLNSIRLQKAKTLLENKKVSNLTEVCFSVGFENTTHFANLFESEFGFRPHQYFQDAKS